MNAALCIVCCKSSIPNFMLANAPDLQLIVFHMWHFQYGKLIYVFNFEFEAGFFKIYKI